MFYTKPILLFCSAESDSSATLFTVDEGQFLAGTQSVIPKILHQLVQLTNLTGPPYSSSQQSPQQQQRSRYRIYCFHDRLIGIIRLYLRSLEPLRELEQP
jgi:hypothetical protein